MDRGRRGAVVGVVLVVIMYIGHGKKPELLDLVMVPLSVAVMAGFGAVLYGWQRYGWPRLKAFMRSRAGILTILALVAVAGLAVLVIANAPPHGAAAAGKFYYYPATLAACGWLVLLVVFAFMQSGGTPPIGGRQRIPDGSENARYLALGVALLAVVALALWRSQKDLASVGSSLPQFFAALPWHSDLLPWPHLIGLAVLALLAVTGVFRAATGWRGPFPKRGLRGAGGDIFWFLAMAGLWLWGAFLPRDFAWFDALDMPGALYTVNFGLQALYLFTVVDSGLTIALLLGGGGSAGGEIGGNTGQRNRPMTPGRQ
jgi:hypothetical protein